MGLGVQNGVVTSWADLAGAGTNLIASGNPRVGAVTPSGARAIVFDGSGDRLAITAPTGTLAELPGASADRTVFFVADYVAPEGVYAGFSYGDGAPNQTFGLVSSDDNQYTVQGWGGGNDFKSGQNAVSGGFQIQSVVLKGNVASHYANGTLIDTDAHVFATDPRSIVIGGEIAGYGESQMAVGAALVYNRALTAAERAEVESYLREKYITPSANTAPLAVNDTVEVTEGGSTLIDILANDDDDAPLLGSMIDIIDGPDHGTLGPIDPTTGRLAYTHDGSLPQADSFTYTVTDANGAVSNPATVTIDVEATPLSLDGFTDEVVVTRGELGGSYFLPISMTFLPDNRMLLLSKSGEVRLVDPESGNNSLLMRLTNIDSGEERGLLDITLDPDFATNGHFYLYYTPGSPEQARVSRFTFNENSGGLTSTADLSSEFVVWQDTDGYPGCCHYGGGLDFGPDGKIWLTTSDKFDSTTPGEGDTGGSDSMLDLASGGGKIIRVNKDGTVPNGSDGTPANPFADGPGGDNDFVWAYGLRNPFRARWDAEYGHMFIGEVGGNQQLVAHDDLHLGGLDQAGAFYGWPFYEGTPSTYVNNNNSPYDRFDFPLPDTDIADAANGDYYSAPIWSLPHNGQEASLTGGEVYRGSMFPDAWDGVYFYGDYTRDTIRYLRLDPTGTRVVGDFAFRPSAELPGTANEIVALTVGADGALYYAMIGSGEIRRITYEGNGAPQILAAAVDIVSGEAPLEITYTARVIDPDHDAVTYSINFSDGTVVNGTVPPNGIISVSHTFTGEGRFAVSMSVSDGLRSTLAEPVEVEVGDVNFAPVIENQGSDVSSGEPNVTEVHFSAQASDVDGDRLTYTWHFGDGTSAAGVVGANGIVSASHVYATEGSFRAYLEVSDGQVTTTSDRVPVQIGVATQVPVTDGLSVLLQSDIKIGLGAGNTVVSWLDGSGNGNNLLATGNPQLVGNQTPTGEAAIVFDGSGDTLQRIDSSAQLHNLAEGNANRTIFAVLDYVDPEGVSAGVVYGNGAQNQTFGIVADRAQRLSVQGWGERNDFPSSREGVSGGFFVQSVTLKDGVTSHFRNGVLIDTDRHTFATDAQKLILGGEIAGLGESQIKIAAVLIYNRAVSDAERAQIESFLQQKYLTLPSGPPDAVNDTATTTEGFAVAIDALANDTDPSGDPLRIASVAAPAHGTAVISAVGTPNDPTDDVIIYTPSNGFIGTDTITYVVSDGNGGTDTATVTVSVTPRGSSIPVAGGLVAAYEADANVSLGAGNTVQGWLDGSGFGNDLVAAGDPELVAGRTPTGEAAIVFDGGGDTLERRHAANSLGGFADNAEDRTVFLVADYVDPEGVWSGISYGKGQPNQAFGLVSSSGRNLAVQGWGGGNDQVSNVNATNGGFLVQSVVLDDNRLSHYRDGALIGSGNHLYDTELDRLVIGGEIAGLGESNMQVAAALIYNRALSDAERASVEQYLYDKYIGDLF